MRLRDFIIFFSIVFSIYGLVNYYIYVHGASALTGYPGLYPWYVGIYLFLSLAFIVGRFLERARITPVSSALIWLGSFWLAAMIYFLIVVVVFDVLLLLNALVPFLPGSLFLPAARLDLMLIVSACIGALVLYGAINARTPRIKRLDLEVNKKSPLTSLNVVVASDIHLGTIICRRRLESIVKKINSLGADLVLLPGDVVDEDIAPVIKQNLGETLRTIRSKYGVVAVTGNHEYIGGVEAACDYLVEHGIVELRDEILKIADSVTIIGREDRSYNRGTERRRKPLAELMKEVDRSLPVILMDHQPFHLEEAEQNGVDLQLSGHTHHAQIWPLSYITKKIFEVSWGYLKKGTTHIYVSCGVGTWGPPVRIGNTPEIMHINLKFK